MGTGSKVLGLRQLLVRTVRPSPPSHCDHSLSPITLQSQSLPHHTAITVSPPSHCSHSLSPTTLRSQSLPHHTAVTVSPPPHCSHSLSPITLRSQSLPHHTAVTVSPPSHCSHSLSPVSRSQDYLWHTLQHSYLPLPPEDGGLGGAWSSAFGQILREVVAVETGSGWNRGLSLLQARGWVGSTDISCAS